MQVHMVRVLKLAIEADVVSSVHKLTRIEGTMFSTGLPVADASSSVC